MAYTSTERIMRHIFIVLFNLHIITANNYSQLEIDNIDTIYSELESLNATCTPTDSCQESRTYDDFISYNCQCGSICAQLDTCCFDSRFRSAAVHSRVSNIKCLAIYGTKRNVFMVDSCKSNMKTHNLDEDLCLGDGEIADDPFLLIPVTSQQTGITYKNYFCFSCNEDTDTAEPIYWNLKLSGNSKSVSLPSLPSVNFDKTLQSWITQEEHNAGIPQAVSIQLVHPNEAGDNITSCHKDIVSECSKEWTDSVTLQKCTSYTAVVLTKEGDAIKRYKNPHCAICNFEDVDKLLCKYFEMHPFSVSVDVSDTLFVGLFSLEDKINRCNKNMVYDQFAKKCRSFKCGKNEIYAKGRCVTNT